MTSDDDLVRRAKSGDAAAWRELYRAHAGRLVVWLHTRPSGDNAVSPEDLANDAWLTAAEKIGEFDGTSSEFAGWLFGIARNHGVNVRRRGLRRRTDAHAQIDEHHLVVAGPELALAGHDWVIRALALLPARERDVVGCIDVVGLDIETTARALDISAVAVRVARHRGLRRLREQGSEIGPPEYVTAIDTISAAT